MIADGLEKVSDPASPESLLGLCVLLDANISFRGHLCLSMSTIITSFQKSDMKSRKKK